MTYSTKQEEVMVPFDAPPERLATCARVRSTLVTSSLKSIRDSGLFDRYRKHLPAAVEDQILYAPAGVWLPIDLVATHYEACNNLGLGAEESARIGGAVADHTQRSALGIVVRLVHESGLTPWTVIEQTPKYWSRLFDGSGVSVIKIGPKEARIETAGNALQRFAYFRNAFRGLMAAMTTPFCTKMYVREVEPPTRLNFRTSHRLSWA